VEFRGWLLEPYISGKHAILWFKTMNGDTVRLQERHHPRFIAESKAGYTVGNIGYLFDEHPDVHATRIVDRFTTLSRKERKKFVEVSVYSARFLDSILEYAKRLPEVEEVYDTGLIPIQWYLIHKDVAPSNLCTVEERDGRLKAIEVVDDDSSVEPPPFEALLFEASDSPIEKINIYDESQRLVSSLRGKEGAILGGFQELIRERDPDVIVTDCPVATIKRVVHRAACNALDFRFGRDGEFYHGRIFLGLTAFLDSGIPGLVERSRFTFAPLGVSADWEPGKTIDSRQCYAAMKMGVVVPKMKGGFGYATTAWDAVRRDRGGMLFSPVVGLHENVACLDFESMFPNVIVHKNVSYETVTSEGVDTSIPGFMGSFTRPFLERRLWLKHQRDTYIPGSPEWWWCQRRQSALKLMLVVVYGYSGCYANRFANVRVFQEINRQARIAMVQALNVCLENGFEVVYGDTDSLFVKGPDASEEDYRELAAEITEETRLRMGLDRHFRYLVLLTRTTDPRMVVARRYYGKLTDGRFFYRGIELRRHDTPKFLKDMQTKMMEALFEADDPETVLREGVEEALKISNRAMRDVRRGRVNPQKLVISKRLRKELSEYRTRQPHIVAAMLGAEEGEDSNYLLLNTGRRNPYLRVMPASLLNGGHRGYDRKKYAKMTRRAAWNLLRPFVPDENYIGGSKYKASILEDYLKH
jgi:DNA polymerase elongation subunit (family B)